MDDKAKAEEIFPPSVFGGQMWDIHRAKAEKALSEARKEAVKEALDSEVIKHLILRAISSGHSDFCEAKNNLSRWREYCDCGVPDLIDRVDTLKSKHQEKGE